MSDDYAEMRKRAEQWIWACKATGNPSAADHARNVLRLLDERDAAEKRLAEESAAAYRRGRADATKSAIAVLDETHASIESGGPSALVDMLGVVVDTIAEAIETREEDWK